MKISVVGVAWFDREDYQTLRDVFSDGSGLPASYSDWLEKAERLLNQIKNQGIEIHRVRIDPKTFPAWCATKGLNIDAKARGRFATETVANMHFDRSE